MSAALWEKEPAPMGRQTAPCPAAHRPLLMPYSSWKLAKGLVKQLQQCSLSPSPQLKQKLVAKMGIFWWLSCWIFFVLHFFSFQATFSYLKKAYYESPTKSITCSTWPPNTAYSKALKSNSSNEAIHFLCFQQLQTKFQIINQLQGRCVRPVGSATWQLLLQKRYPLTNTEIGKVPACKLKAPLWIKLCILPQNENNDIKRQQQLQTTITQTHLSSDMSLNVNIFKHLRIRKNQPIW